MARSQKPLLALVIFLAGGAAFGAWYLRQSLGAPAAIESSAAPVYRDELAGSEADRAVVEGLAPAPDDVDSTETTVAWPVLLDLQLVESAELPSAEGVPTLGSGSTATLRGKVIDRGGQGIAGVRIELVAGPNQGREFVTNEQGEYGASGLHPGLGIARIQGAGLLGAMRQVRLRRDAETLLNVSFQRPSQVWMTVHGDDGEGLEGVEVRLDGQVARSDEYGDCYFPSITPGRDIVVELEKEGYASYGGLLGVSLGYDVPKGKIQYRMTRACKLEVIVSSSAGGKGSALVVVMPDNPLARPVSATTALGGHPVNPTDYPWYRSMPKRVSVGGRASFDDLPQQSVKVRVFHEGAAMQQSAVGVHLKPSKPQSVSVSLEAAPRLVGRATIDGEPASGASVVLEAPDRTAATLQYFSENWIFLESMPIPSLPVAVQEVEADQDGRFVLSTWPELARSRYLRITSRDGRHGDVSLVAAGTERVDVALEPLEAGGARLEVEFPGRFQGLPVQLSLNGEPRPEVVVPASENLVLEGVSAGIWTLGARWNGRDLVSPPERFEVDGVTVHAVPLPEDAIIGQDLETLTRARGL